MDSIEMTKPDLAVPPAQAPMPTSCCPPYSRLQLPLGALRSWIGNRYVLIAAGFAVVGSGMALGWGWLTAIGVAPLIVSVAPCLIMCAVGGCLMCRRGPGAAAPAATIVSTDTPPVAEK